MWNSSLINWPITDYSLIIPGRRIPGREVCLNLSADLQLWRDGQRSQSHRIARPLKTSHEATSDAWRLKTAKCSWAPLFHAWVTCKLKVGSWKEFEQLNLTPSLRKVSFVKEDEYLLLLLWSFAFHLPDEMQRPCTGCSHSRLKPLNDVCRQTPKIALAQPDWQWMFNPTGSRLPAYCIWRSLTLKSDANFQLSFEDEVR